MFFAAVLSEHPGEVRADLQRFYGVCLDDLGKTVSVRHAAALAAHLPPGSATAAKYDPRLGWTVPELLLLRLVNLLSAPDCRLDPFGELGGGDGMSCAAMEVDELRAYLARPREDVMSDGV